MMAYYIAAAIGGVVLIALGIAYWNSHIAEPYRVQGDIRTITAYNGPKGVITLLRQDLKRVEGERDLARSETDVALATAATTKGSLDRVTQSLLDAMGRADHWLAEATAAQAKSTRLQAQLRTQKQRYAAEIAAAQAVASGPPQPESAAKIREYLVNLANWRRATVAP